jgi:exodeoxyribonuclease V beta subunit
MGHVKSVPFEPDSADLSGLTVIEASAGTGKTHAIQKLVARLVREGVPMPRMLLMSFTNAAAAELSHRVRAELQEALQSCSPTASGDRLLLQRALGEFDRACISTIHGFCQRMLVEHAMEAGAHGLQGWSLQTDETETRRRVCGDAWAALVAPSAELAAAVGSLKVVTGGLRKALDRRRELERVQAADFGAAKRAVERAIDSLRQPDAQEALRAVRDNFNAKARAAAERILDQLRGGPIEPGAVVAACGWLLDVAKMQGDVPKRPAAKATAAHALLSGSSWPTLRALLQALADAVDGVGQAAIDSVVRDALRRLLEHRAIARTVTFDDLITRLRDAVIDPSGAMRQVLRERFDVVIVDEVQDTDPVQAEILRVAFAHSPQTRLILVGDPKQSIYAFRNADVDAYMALRGLSPKPTYRLDVSHRSDQALIDGVQRLYAVPSPFLRGDIPAMAVRSVHPQPRIHGPSGAAPGLALHVTTVTETRAVLDLTARAIAADLRAGWRIDEVHEGVMNRRNLSAGDIAVLCHQHWQGRRVAESLQALGVPVVIMDRQGVLQSRAAKGVLGLLAAMSRPWDRTTALGALAGVCTGLRAKDAIEMPDAWVRWLREATELLGRQGVAAALRWLVLQVGPEHGRLATLAAPGGERLVTDFDHVLEELEKAQCAGAATPHALATWLAQRVHDAAPDDESTRCRAIGGLDAVQVMTLHGSKGLTFGVVWLPTFMVPTTAQDHDGAEARRLLYVGLTRARYVTRAVWMPDGKASASPLAQLLHAREQSDPECIADDAALRLKNPDLARSDLDKLGAASEGAIAVLPLEVDDGPPASCPPPAGLVPARAMPGIPDRAVMLSFTSLSSVKKSAEAEVQERDVDAVSAPPREGPPTPVTEMDAALRAVGVSGAALGTLVHDALAESGAFACLAPGADPGPLHEALRRHSVGLPIRSDASLKALAEALPRALSSGTGRGDIATVCEVAAEPDRCLRELDVAVPWHAAPAALAKAMQLEDAPWSGRVAAMLERGEARERLGSLVGSIDLAVERHGQWFIYDYKTNFVGDAATDYEQASLDGAMAAELYPLQASLYSVMLTRWLAARGWKPVGKPVIGGVAYLFLRGMSPAAGSRGTWIWTPSERLLRALDALLPGPAAGGSP